MEQYTVILDDDEMLLLLQCLERMEKSVQAEKAKRCRTLYDRLEIIFERRD